MILLTCEVLVGGEHGGAVAVFPRDGETKAVMAWCGPTPRPKHNLTLTKEKKGSEGGAAARFAGIGDATAANPTTENLRNAAHLGEISSN